MFSFQYLNVILIQITIFIFYMRAILKFRKYFFLILPALWLTLPFNINCKYRVSLVGTKRSSTTTDIRNVTDVYTYVSMFKLNKITD